ncbi:MAG: carbohydrate ABC transporter permease [Dictyoglomi bacterium]|nr:carbohydrate ABC transporter permease [Dictyoglomota bacterium]
MLKNRKIVKTILSHVLLIFFSACFALPLFWLVSTSLKPNEEIFVFPPKWIPSHVFLGHYNTAINFIPFFRYLANTLTICIFTVLGTVISASLVAYGFSRIDWPERDLFFMLLVSTMMIPYAVVMIPLYVTFSKLRWINTFKPLIVPAFFAPAFSTFLLRQFFMTIPAELSDAARIDGASEFYIYRGIILPLARPALAVVALFQFIGAWNDFLGPLIYLRSEEKYTLALGLQQFRSALLTEWGGLMAASTLVTLPIVVLFFFTQKTFIQGISLTGLKE